MSAIEKCFLAVLIGGLGLLIGSFIWFRATHECVRSHVEVVDYVDQPMYVGNQHFKFPVGGGRIRHEKETVCDEYAPRR